jgi:predicted AlkP superfamily pyrophosphatase or phosphodiesterase
MINLDSKNFSIYTMKAIAPTISRILKINPPSQAKEGPIMPIVEAFDNVKRVAVLAIDALGYKAYEKFKDSMPYMSSIIRNNGELSYLKSILPSITPVNFACMVTGVEVDVHMVKARSQDFGCESLFDVLRSNDKKSAGLGRENYTGNELLGRFADFTAGGSAINDNDVEEVLLKTIRHKIPEFIIVQYALVDDISHSYGPYSEQAGEAIAKADEWLLRCIPELCKYEYGVIILSDHGQHEFQKPNGTIGGTHGSDIDEDCIVPLAWIK